MDDCRAKLSAVYVYDLHARVYATLVRIACPNNVTVFTAERYARRLLKADDVQPVRIKLRASLDTHCFT